jgi:hypothetical protein
MYGSCNTHGESGRFLQNFVRKPEGKRSLGRSRYRWEENIRMDIREMGWEDVDWLNPAEDRE